MQHPVIIGLMGYSEDEKGNFSGVKRVGKDEFAKVAKTRNGVGVFAFAKALKTLLAQTYNLNLLECEEDKNKPILNGYSWRQLCERFGLEVVRKGLSNDNIWIRTVCAEIRLFLSPNIDCLTAQLLGLQPDHIAFPTLRQQVLESMKTADLPSIPEPVRKIAIVTDVRFYNEYKSLKTDGAIMVRIKRTVPGSRCTGHASDSFDERMIPDVEIHNDDSLQSFHAKVNDFLSKLIIE